MNTLTLATFFTVLRIILTPCIVYVMINQYWGAAFLLFIIASTTDVIDGALARKWNQETVFGACLDPIADKFLLISCFSTLAFIPSPLFSIPLWFVLIVLIKELLLVVGVAMLYFLKGSIQIKPTWLGKITTLMQIIFIIWLFACYFFGWVPIKAYYVMLGLLLFLVLATLAQYSYLGYRYYKDLA